MIPKIRVAFTGWQSPISLIKITQSIVDYQVVNTETLLRFKGVIQPLGPKELVIKPISERSWKWLQIHTYNELAVDNNDRIKYKGETFKIMLNSDYDLNGFYEYHLVKDYE